MSHLALGLSKRFSGGGTPSSQKRRSVSLNASTGSGTPVGTPARASRPPDTPSSFTSDDGNVTSRNSSPSLSSLRGTMKDQAAQIERLEELVDDLRAQLAARPTEDELDSMRKEWETSENLFAQSQKDNEQKHAAIEHLRQYVKALEHKLEEMLGDRWRECCTLPQQTPTHPGAAFASSTPLPRPGTNTMTRSSSTKRASRHSRTGSFEANRLRELRELGASCQNTTPTSALRRLEGINESPASSASPASPAHSTPTPNPLSMSTRSTCSTADCMEVDGLIDTASQFTASPSARSVAHGPPSSKASSCDSPTPNLADQVAQLTALINALPTTIVTRISADEERAAERARIEEQKVAMLEMLDAAEQRADAREMRLQGMIAEAKACSGQMGW